MSTFGSFIKSSFGILGNKKHLNRPLSEDDLNETSFRDILHGMEKLDPLNANVEADAKGYADNYMRKLKLTTKQEEKLKDAQEMASYFMINRLDRKVRQFQIDALWNIACAVDESMGKPRPVAHRLG